MNDKQSSKSNLIRTYHAKDRRWTIHHGDVQAVLPTLGRSLNDGIITDAPYGLKFMGHGSARLRGHSAMLGPAVRPQSVWARRSTSIRSGRTERVQTERGLLGRLM